MTTAFYMITLLSQTIKTSTDHISLSALQAPLTWLKN